MMEEPLYRFVWIRNAKGELKPQLWCGSKDPMFGPEPETAAMHNVTAAEAERKDALNFLAKKYPAPGDNL